FRQALRDVGLKFIENDLEMPSLNTVIFLCELGELTAKQKFEKSTEEILGFIREMVEAIAKSKIKNSGITIELSILSLKRIGIAAAENKHKNVTKTVAEILNDILKFKKE
ncbi:MAG: hypothetical protein MPEBLZ_02347, partial [Candidatus Methanoperedens nitroreducens]